MINIDASELAGLGARLAASRAVSGELVKASVEKGAYKVKTAIQQDLAGSGNTGFKGIRIHYDTGSTGNTHYADIAPLNGGASDLANIAFFGTARGGGTHQFYEHAQQELPVLTNYVGSAAMVALGLMTGG